MQEVIVEWPTLQANVTNELLLGRAPPGQYFCKFNNITQCRRTPEFQYEPLSCHIGMDVLGKLFNRSELRKATCSAHPLFRCDVICVKVLVKNSFGASESDPAKLNLLHQGEFLIFIMFYVMSRYNNEVNKSYTCTYKIVQRNTHADLLKIVFLFNN